jgi:hypothetical protein
MTDLELLDKYCEHSIVFVHPLLLQDVIKRGLYEYINHLPPNSEEAKTVVRARLAEKGLFTGNERVDKINDMVRTLNRWKKEFNELSMANPHQTIPLLDKMRLLSETLLSYYK